MFHFIRQTRRPSGYHGRGQRPPFFEGWYFKLVDASEQQRYAVIPGIFLGADTQATHAFVQILNGTTGESSYHVYPAQEFQAAEDELDVRVGPNRFQTQRIVLDIDDAGQRVRGELHFENLSPWPVTWTAPGIMGWYAWVPFMQCYHGVVSLDHALQGSLSVAGREIDFSGGRGYTEKDWGRSFPDAWIWMQSNHFEQPGTSLSASVAIIPWLGTAFPGFIIGLWHEGRLYRFATYSGATIESLEADDRTVRWHVTGRDYRLEIEARRASGGLLMAPTTVQMDRRIAETLNATIAVRLLQRGHQGFQVVFAGSGRCAGLEAAGDLARLIEMWHTRRNTSSRRAV